MAAFMALLSRMMPLRRWSDMYPWSDIHLENLYRRLLYVWLVLRFMRYCFMPPTERSIDMLLSLRMMSMSLGDEETLFSPSKASPPDMAPSPMTAITWRRLSSRRDATAMPSAAEMLFDACPHVKVSYSDSSGEGKGFSPWSLRFVGKRSRRPVSILWA